MPKSMKLAAGWALAAMIALALSWGAVASVRNQVIQPSVQLPINTASALATAPTNQTTTSEPTVIRVEPEAVDTTTSTDEVSASTTTTPLVSGTTPPTATSTATTVQATATTTTQPQATTTTAAPRSQTSSYTLVGGVVTISHSPGVVTFVSAIPQPGYSTDRKEIGPDEVRIRFESDDHTSDFRAQWSNGALEITESEAGES